MLLGILPVVPFGIIGLVIASRWPKWSWGAVILRSSLFMGIVSVLSAEALGAFGLIGRGPFIVTWVMMSVGASLLLYRVVQDGNALRLPEMSRFEANEWALIICMAVVVIVTFAVSWFSPPNTWDSLTTHLARVAHWAQNGSLDHYATGIEQQNYTAIGPSVAMLQVYVLSGGDWLVSFVPWICTIIAMLAVADGVRLLGGSRVAQLFSSVFLITLPTGVVQASSTLIDYFAAVWLLILLVELLRFRSNGQSIGLVTVSIAAALAINSKPTVAPYLLVMGAYGAWIAFRRKGWTGPLTLAGVTVIAALIINAGYFSRNMATFGNPIGRATKVENHRNEQISLAVMASNSLRNASLHAGTNWEPWNEFVYLGLTSIHSKLGLALNEPGTSIHPDFDVYPPSTDEVRSGSFWHALIILATSVGLIVFWRRTPNGAKQISIVGILAFITFSTTFQFTIFGSRYHLPFFMIMSPVVGLLWGKLAPKWVLSSIAVFLILTSWPWLVHIENRPLLPSEDANYSIVTEQRKDLYLPYSYQRALDPMSTRISQSECRRVGLMINGNSPEYALWAFLGAPDPDLEIRWVVAGTPSEKYTVDDFEPCAIICENCPEAITKGSGLQNVYAEHTFHLYLEE